MPGPFATPNQPTPPATQGGGPVSNRTTVQFSDPRIQSGDSLSRESEQDSRNALIAAMVAADQGATPDQIAQISGTYDTTGGPGLGQSYRPPPEPGQRAPGGLPFLPPGQGSPAAGPPSGGKLESLGAASVPLVVPGVPRPGQAGYTPPEGEELSGGPASKTVKVGDHEYTPQEIEEMAGFAQRREEIQANLYAKLNEIKSMATGIEQARQEAEQATQMANYQMQHAQQMQAWAAQNPEAFAEWASSQPAGGMPYQPMGYAPPSTPFSAGRPPTPQPSIESNFDPSTFRAELLGEVKSLLTSEGQSKVRQSADGMVKDLVSKDPMFNGREEEVKMWAASELRKEAAAGRITHQTEGWDLQQKISGLLQKKSNQDKQLFDAYASQLKGNQHQAAASLTPPIGTFAATAVPTKPVNEQQEHDFFSHSSDRDFNDWLKGQMSEFEQAIQGLAAG